MDIQKERAAFEEFEFTKRPFASRKVLFQKYDTARIGDGNEGKYYCAEMQEKWEIWQHLKASAVPEGFVLVPKEIPDHVVQRLENSLYHWGDLTRDYFTPIYEMMIEAAEVK
ncbi:hypothetical protein [Acinetobacter larvae]|nr:hypothetical protein [Acinetobacter larvae]